MLGLIMTKCLVTNAKNGFVGFTYPNYGRSISCEVALHGHILSDDFLISF